MDAFDLGRAYDALAAFCEELTNWYIRLSRRRFWEPTAPLDDATRQPFDTLFVVLHRVARIAAPLLPFQADWLAAQLGATDSVHLDDWPQPVAHWADATLLSENDAVARVVRMARAVRADHKVPNRQPLGRALVVGVDADVVARYGDVLRAELNVKDVAVRTDAGELATTKIVPDPRVLGPRLGPAVQEVLRAARDGDVAVRDDGTALVAGHELAPGEFSVAMQAASADIGVTAERDLVVGLDLTVTPELELEGFARQVIRRVQDLRKAAGLDVSDRIALRVTGGRAADIVAAHGEMLGDETLALSVDSDGAAFDASDTFALAGDETTVSLRRA